MSNSIRWAAIALALLLTPTLARAVEIYAGGGVGSDFDAGTGSDPVNRAFGSSITGDRYKLFAGLGLGRHLAVEASYYDFGGRRCCEPIVPDFAYDVDTDAYSAAVVGRLPLGRVSLFGKVGTLWWDESGRSITIAGASPWSETGTDLVTGAGVGFRLTDHVHLRGEWERYEFPDRSTDGVWAAAEFRF
jgi:hypothetical protein